MAPYDRFSHIIASADSFCTWAGAEPATADIEAKKAVIHLSRLYAAGVELATLDMADVESADEDDVITLPEAWKQAYRRFDSLPLSLVYELVDPLAARAVCQECDIQEALADIHADISAGMSLHRQGKTARALWHWKLTFEYQWGRRALILLSALHSYFQQDSDFEIFASEE